MDSGHGRVKTQNLAEGDFLVGHDGRLVMVNGLEFSAERNSVCSLEVADYHAYFVGDPSWGFSIWARNEGVCATAVEGGSRGGFKSNASHKPT